VCVCGEGGEERTGESYISQHATNFVCQVCLSVQQGHQSPNTQLAAQFFASLSYVLY
jgi:hypothetical protein